MTEPTINLQKDLEVWTDFTTEYYNDRQNKVQDKSGYGRHGQLENGATLGVSGPQSFDAVSFDSGGENVRYAAGENVINDPPFSAAILLNNDQDNNPREIFGSVNVTNSGWAIVQESGGRNYKVRIDNQGLTAIASVEVGNWQFLGFSYDGSKVVTFYDGLASRIRDGLSGFTAHGSDLQLGNTESQFFGDVAFVGLWSRVVTGAEFRYMNELTAPRRAQL